FSPLRIDPRIPTSLYGFGFSRVAPSAKGALAKSGAATSIFETAAASPATIARANLIMEADAAMVHPGDAVWRPCLAFNVEATRLTGGRPINRLIVLVA